MSHVLLLSATLATLSGLPGVTRIVTEFHEDSKEFKDHLHVTYDPGKITQAQIVEAIRKTGLRGTVVPGPGQPTPP